jgi:hypothetical protein
VTWRIAPWHIAAMGTIVNLNKATKARRKQAEAQAAAENRVRHGRTKAERERDRRAEERRQAALDGAKAEPDGAASS